ncbi:MAG: hypothetical protein LC657_18855, partial [Desulfobacteraceae bacterium]|nr:hypothetical protein [Desulfobacteraceae bacterium]
RTFHQMKPGGIFSFDNSFYHEKKGCYISGWADALAYDEASAERYVDLPEAVNVNVVNPKEGNPYGIMRAYDTDEENHITATAVDKKMYEAIKVLLDEGEHTRPGFLIRLLNENGEVFDFEEILKDYNTNEGRPMTSEEQAAYVCRTLLDNMTRNGVTAASFNVLPISKFSISAKALETDANGKSKLNKFLAISKGFHKVHEMPDGEKVFEIFAKPALVQFSEDGQFVNKISTRDPMGPGMDPCLIGGLKADPSAGASDDQKGAQDKSTANIPSAPPEEPSQVIPADMPVDMPPETDPEMTSDQSAFSGPGM